MELTQPILMYHIPYDLERSTALHTDDDPPVFQVAWEWQQVQRLYRFHRPQKVLEIGTFHGGTLKAWCEQARPDTTIVSVDSYTAGVDNRQWYDSWCPQDVNVVAFCGRSDDPAIIKAVSALAPYDWLLIDADHSYAGAAHDWQTYAPLVQHGGIILLHDINERDDYGVATLWREIQARGFVTQELRASVIGVGGMGVVYV